jgi:hypothetical protein
MRYFSSRVASIGRAGGNKIEMPAVIDSTEDDEEATWKNSALEAARDKETSLSVQPQARQISGNKQISFPVIDTELAIARRDC